MKTKKISIITLILIISFFVKAEDSEQLIDQQHRPILRSVANSTLRNLADYGTEGSTILEAIETCGYAGPLEAYLEWSPFTNPGQRPYTIIMESGIKSQLSETGTFGRPGTVNENGNIDLIPNGSANYFTFPTWDKNGPNTSSMSEIGGDPEVKKLYILEQGMVWTGIVRGPRFIVAMPDASKDYSSPSSQTNAEIDAWITLIMKGLKDRGILQNFAMSRLSKLSYLMEIGTDRQLGNTKMHGREVSGVYSIAPAKHWGDPDLGAGSIVMVNKDGSITGSQFIQSWFVYKDRLFFRITTSKGAASETFVTVAIPKSSNKRVFCFDINGEVFMALKHWDKFINLVGGPQFSQK